MRKSRHMVVEHHVKDEELKIVDGRVTGKQPIHDLVGTYHWLRIDDAHIFMVADYSISHHVAIHAHAKVSVLPVVGSSKHLHKHLKGRHFEALKNRFNLDETHTSEDIIDTIVAIHGPLYGQ